MPALKSANLIGDGFYRVDIKQMDNHCYVIKVNDNPNVDEATKMVNSRTRSTVLL